MLSSADAGADADDDSGTAAAMPTNATSSCIGIAIAIVADCFMINFGQGNLSIFHLSPCRRASSAAEVDWYTVEVLASDNELRNSPHGVVGPTRSPVDA